MFKTKEARKSEALMTGNSRAETLAAQLVEAEREVSVLQTRLDQADAEAVAAAANDDAYQAAASRAAKVKDELAAKQQRTEHLRRAAAAAHEEENRALLTALRAEAATFAEEERQAYKQRAADADAAKDRYEATLAEIEQRRSDAARATASLQRQIKLAEQGMAPRQIARIMELKARITPRLGEEAKLLTRRAALSGKIESAEHLNRESTYLGKWSAADAARQNADQLRAELAQVDAQLKPIQEERRRNSAEIDDIVRSESSRL